MSHGGGGPGGGGGGRKNAKKVFELFEWTLCRFQKCSPFLKLDLEENSVEISSLLQTIFKNTSLKISRWSDHF